MLSTPVLYGVLFALMSLAKADDSYSENTGYHDNSGYSSSTDYYNNQGYSESTSSAMAWPMAETKTAAMSQSTMSQSTMSKSTMSQSTMSKSTMSQSTMSQSKMSSSMWNMPHTESSTMSRSTSASTMMTTAAATKDMGWSMSYTTTTASATSALAAAGSSCTQVSGSLLVQVVSVSDVNGSLVYSPDQVVAPVGSMVEFHFHPKNHTVTQSSFAAPCVPLGVSNHSAITATSPGIDSGFVPVSANLTTTGFSAMSPIVPSYTIMINDTKPIWIYCAQTGHCMKGMAMVINQNMSDTVHTLDNYKAAAAKLGMTNSSSSAASSMTMSNGYNTMMSSSSGGGAYGASTSSMTAAPAFATQASATSAKPIAANTTMSASVSVATFLGAAARPTVAVGVKAVVGLAAMGVAALL